MNLNINRQQFLTGDAKGLQLPQRPPWSVVENEFTTLCNGCGECWQQCPENILSKGRGGYPVIDFQQGECTFCQRCVEVCSSHAITSAKNVDPWLVELNVSNNCITQQGIVCGTCVEQCETEAITIVHQIARVPQVKVESSLCNGCGACTSTCPTHSIRVIRKAYSISTNQECLP